MPLASSLPFPTPSPTSLNLSVVVRLAGSGGWESGERESWRESCSVFLCSSSGGRLELWYLAFQPLIPLSRAFLLPRGHLCNHIRLWREERRETRQGNSSLRVVQRFSVFALFLSCSFPHLFPLLPPPLLPSETTGLLVRQRNQRVSFCFT